MLHYLAFRLLHAYWQKTEYVLKCSFFSQDEGIHENERGNIHWARCSLWIWGFNLFLIHFNIIIVLLVSSTKVWPPNVVLKSTHAHSYLWSPLSVSFSTNMWSHTVHGTIMGSSLNLMVSKENYLAETTKTLRVKA